MAIEIRLRGGHVKDNLAPRLSASSEDLISFYYIRLMKISGWYFRPEIVKTLASLGGSDCNGGFVLRISASSQDRSSAYLRQGEGGSALEGGFLSRKAFFGDERRFLDMKGDFL